MPCVRRIPLVAHPAIFAPRFRLTETGELLPRGITLSKDRLQEWFELHLTTQPVEIGTGIWTTGEISNRNTPEGRSQQHVVITDSGIQPDPYTDDMALLIEGQGDLLLLSGCCHAGLVNTLQHVQQIFGKKPGIVVGGTHLGDLPHAELQQVVELLKPFQPLDLWVNHCTGERGFTVLTQHFGRRVKDFPAGSVLNL